MLLKNLINKSWYGTIGYVAKDEDLQALEQYILYNLPVLKEFQNIVVATNYNGNYQQQNTELWKKYFPNCIIIDSHLNRGHNHGYTDLDNLVFGYCKENNIEWLCKSANDVIFEESILDKEIGTADFYYMNGIGFGGMFNYDFDFDRIVKRTITEMDSGSQLDDLDNWIENNRDYISEYSLKEMLIELFVIAVTNGPAGPIGPVVPVLPVLPVFPVLPV